MNAQQAGRWLNRGVSITWGQVLALIVPGLGFAGWAVSLLLSLNTAWTTVETRVATLERSLAALGTEQAAGRARGDSRQVQINVLDRQVAVIATRLDDLLELSRAQNEKLDRIMERQFGGLPYSPSRPP